MEFKFDFDIPQFSVVGKIHDYLNNQDSTYDEELASIAADAMKDGLVRQIMKDREQKPGRLRLSNSGPCARKIAYAYLGIPENGKEIDARARVTFLTGDLLEVVVTALIKQAGIQTTWTCLDEGGQEDILLSVPDRDGNIVEVPGHPDGKLLVQEGLDEPVLLEIKSTSDYAYKYKFERGIIDTGYALQHQAYLEATGLRKGLFVAINKNTGHLTEVWTAYNPEFVEWARNNHKAALESTPDNLPFRYNDGDAYGVKLDKRSKELVLAPLCTYCAWYKTCWGEDNLDMQIVSGKPVHFIGSLPEDFNQDESGRLES